MSFSSPDTNVQPNNNVELLGAFSAYNRRPIPSNSGLTAQFYGENGEDSDTITALGLSKFHENQAFIRVYWVKDSNGSLKQKDDQTFPIICEFNATIQRPKGLRDGVLAQLFASNGNDSDAVNDLSLFKYLDALVFIEIYSANPSQSFEISNPQIIQEIQQTANLLTPKEKKILEKKQKEYQQMNQHLKMSTFFKQPSVWAALGDPLNFSEWIQSINCIAPIDPPCMTPTTIFKLPEGTSQYHIIPLCEHHQEELKNNTLAGGLVFLKLKHMALIQEWAWVQLKKHLNYTDLEPSPEKIIIWANANRLTQYMPSIYKPI